jgi:EAL domain-containing protein (putative c-di-GMP-specific phosphodiesterase class I)
MTARAASDRPRPPFESLARLVGGDRRGWVVLVGSLVVVALAATGLGGTRVIAGGLLLAVPGVVAVVPYGRRGALVVAAVTGLLSGVVPVADVGVVNPILASGLRTAALVAIAAVAAWAVATVEERYRDELVRQLDLELLPPDEVADVGDPCAADELRRILEEGRFHPVFQPVYSLHDGGLVAVEALTRFDTTPPTPPNVMFERADRAGLGDEFELAAVAAALAASEQLPAEVTLAVNCSPRTLRHPGLLELVAGRGARPMIVEVTEHDVVDDYVGLTAAIGELRAYDVGLAVDDAGAGFASLRHVVRLGPELIKLDLSLTQNLRGDPVREALADCLIDFARRTGSQLVAEGIESVTDLTMWVDLGADAAQGYLLGRPGPLPVEAVNERVLRSIAG